MSLWTRSERPPRFIRGANHSQIKKCQESRFKPEPETCYSCPAYPSCPLVQEASAQTLPKIREALSRLGRS